jgi:hypothetical protein
LKNLTPDVPELFHSAFLFISHFPLNLFPLQVYPAAAKPVIEP